MELQVFVWGAVVCLGGTLSLLGALFVRDEREGWGVAREGVLESGSVPGYMVLPSDALDAEKMGLGDGALCVESVETFHNVHRRRVVVTLVQGTWRIWDVLGGLDEEGEESRRVREALCRRLYEVAVCVEGLTGADVVVVELRRRGDRTRQKSWTGVWSRDGKAWSGEQRLMRFFVQGPVMAGVVHLEEGV